MTVSKKRWASGMVILNLVMAFYLAGAGLIMHKTGGDNAIFTWPCIAASGVMLVIAGGWWWYKDRPSLGE